MKRVAYFRLSEDDYAALEALRDSEGYKSVSDLIRTVMHRFLHGIDVRNAESDRYIQAVADDLARLGEALKQLAGSIAKVHSAGRPIRPVGH